jgi:hypothetical protein
VVVGLAVVLVSFAIDTTVSVCTLNVCLTCFDFSFGHILVGITSLSQALRHWKYMFVCCSYARLASSVLCVFRGSFGGSRETSCFGSLWDVWRPSRPKLGDLNHGLNDTFHLNG